MSHYHCVVWIDHREAHVIHFNPDDAEESIIHPKSKHKAHLHHKDGVIGAGKTPPDDKYNQEAADAIKDAGEILIVGPSTAKLELFKYLQKHAPAIAARVVESEKPGPPPAGEPLLTSPRRHFEADDRMRPQI